MKFLIFFLLLLFPAFQTTRAQEIPYIDLYPDTALTVLGPHFYLDKVLAIAYAPTYGYFIGDDELSQIAWTNRQFQLIRTLGKPGEGPEELMGISFLHLWGDTLFVGTDRIIKKFLLPDFVYLDRYLIRSRCAHCVHVTPYGIVQTVVSSEDPIRLYDLHGRLVRQFGRMLEPDHPASAFFNFRVGVFITESQDIIAVPRLHPQIERYTLEGKVQEILTLNQPPLLTRLFQEAWDRTQELQRKQPYMLAQLWGDAAYAKGWLYLAVAMRWPEAPHIQHVLVVRVTRERMVLSHILRLHRDQTPLQMGLLEADRIDEVSLSARLIEVIPQTGRLLARMFPEDLLYVYTLPEQP